MTEVHSPSPNIDQSDLPILPAKWQWAQFKETCHRVSVGHVGPTTEFFTDEPDGIRFLRSQNVRPSKLEFENALSITPNFHKKLKKSQLIQGDILIVRVGANRGDCCVVPSGMGELNCANIVFARPKDPNGFHAYFFQSDLGRELLLSASVGAAQGVINTGSVATMPVPCPPLNVQRRIGGILSAYDELIENNQQRIKILEAMARALYCEWFVYRRFPGHESVTFVQSILGEIPHGWEAKTIREVAALISRGPSLTYVDSGGVQVVNQRCVRNERIEMQAVQYAAPLPTKKSHLYLQPRDILINSMGVGTLGRVSRNLSIDEPTIIHNCITVVRSKASEPTQLFLYYRLSECQEYFESLGIGATGQTSLRIETIEDVQVALPSATLLEAFENLVSPMWTQVGVLKHQIENLRAARDLLLPRLLSGRIEVEAIAS